MTERNDNHYMNKALQQAVIAEKYGEVPVGSLLVTEDGREFATYNAPVSLHDTSAHAEIRAIRAACNAMENYRLPGSTLYITLEPCPMCAGAIIHARIGRVVYGASDAKTGAVESVYQMLSDIRLNHQPEITGGIMAERCSFMLREFFQRRRQKFRD